jgi:hypothetical protein
VDLLQRAARHQRGSNHQISHVLEELGQAAQDSWGQDAAVPTKVDDCRYNLVNPLQQGQALRFVGFNGLQWVFSVK